MLGVQVIDLKRGGGDAVFGQGVLERLHGRVDVRLQQQLGSPRESPTTPRSASDARPPARRASS
jgi:hypothetical protein